MLCAMLSVTVRSALLPVMAVSGGGLFPSSPSGSCRVLDGAFKRLSKLGADVG